MTPPCVRAAAGSLHANVICSAFIERKRGGIESPKNRLRYVYITRPCEPTLNQWHDPGDCCRQYHRLLVTPKSNQNDRRSRFQSTLSDDFILLCTGTTTLLQLLLFCGALLLERVKKTSGMNSVGRCSGLWNFACVILQDDKVVRGMHKHNHRRGLGCGIEIRMSPSGIELTGFHAYLH